MKNADLDTSALRDAPRYRSRREGLRRALGLSAISTLIPGTGHLAAGKKRAGAAILIIFLALVGYVVYYVVTRSKGDLASIAFNPDQLWFITIGAALVALAWCGVIVSIYLETAPRAMAPAARLLATVVVLTLCALVAVPLSWGAATANETRQTVTHVFAPSKGGS